MSKGPSAEICHHKDERCDSPQTSETCLKATGADTNIEKRDSLQRNSDDIVECQIQKRDFFKTGEYSDFVAWTIRLTTMFPSGCDAVERESERCFRDDRETSRFFTVERAKARKRETV